ncbi:hypothetical protein [Caulobacter sp. LARHSG274]
MAVMLMAMLVVQTPIATVDRLLHDAGRAHAANAFLGAVVDSPEHEQDGDHDHTYIAADHGEYDDTPAAQTVADEPSSDPAAPGLNHHHHHDGPSVFGLTESLSLAVAWSSSSLPFGSNDDLRKGIDAFQQDRPPKAHLAHVA